MKRWLALILIVVVFGFSAGMTIYLLEISRQNRDNHVYGVGRADGYNSCKMQQAGTILPKGDEKVLHLETFVDT